MKWRVRILISLVLIPLMLLSLVTSSLLFKGVVADGIDYKQKIVAVVYDNSGSMSTDNRDDYAHYAMQGLMSVLDSKDTLVVFPLNTTYGESVKVNLAAADRNGEVASIISHKAFRSSGSTPPKAIGRAVTWLSEQGLNQDEVLEGKEFWLVILSDGEFDGSKTTSELIRENISGYVGLQTVYFGMCASDSMRIDDLVAENSAVSAYYTSTSAEIIQAMQDITNRTTGRYTMTKGIVNNGSQMEIDLSTCGFSVVSVAVLAQGSGQSVELTSVESSGAEVEIQRPCSISSLEVMMSGYSAMISPKNDAGYLNGEKLTLNFGSAPESITILLEPAIALESTLQHYGDNGWVDVTEEVVNTTLKKGAQLRTKYRLIDKMTGKNLTDILNDVTATVSYNGKISSYEQGFVLETGKKEVALSVTVNISGAKYTLYNSWLCDIDENPTNFRIESNTTKGYNGNPQKVKTDYTIYYDNAKVAKSDFEGVAPKLSWQVLSITDPAGNSIEADSAVVNSDGTISVVYSTKQGEYGAYSSKLKVICLENKRSRTCTEEVRYFPTTLSIESGANKEIKLSLNRLVSNTDKFEFNLSSGGAPISFESGVVGYKLTIAGVDVTSMVTLNGSTLSFMPDSTTITGSLKNIGQKDVVLEVWSSEDPSVKTTLKLTFEILNSVYEVQTIADNTTVDIYDLKNCQAKIYYKLSIDGEWLNEQQLTQALQDKTISVDTHPFGWIFLMPTKVDVSVQTFNGDAVLCVSVGSGWFSPLDNLFASFIMTGEKQITVRYGNAEGEGIFNLTEVDFTSRLWRWVVIVITVYIILHIVLWIIGFAVAKSLPKGVMVKMVLNQDLPTQAVSANTKSVNMTTKEKVKWHFKRFIPFKEFMNQDPVVLYGIKLCVTNDRERRMVLGRAMSEVNVVADDEDMTYLNYIEFKKKWRNYVKGNKKPKLASFSTKKFNYLLEDKDKEHKAGKALGVNENCYATRGKKGFDTIMFFIQTK